MMSCSRVNEAVCASQFIIYKQPPEMSTADPAIDGLVNVIQWCAESVSAPPRHTVYSDPCLPLLSADLPKYNLASEIPVSTLDLL